MDLKVITDRKTCFQSKKCGWAYSKHYVIKELFLKILCCQSCHFPLPQVGRKLTKSVIVAPGIRKSSARHCPDYSNNSEIRRNKEKQSLKKLLQLTKPICKEIMMDGICLPKSYCISCLCRKKTPPGQSQNFLHRNKVFFCDTQDINFRTNPSPCFPYDCNADTLESRPSVLWVQLLLWRISGKALILDLKLRMLIDSQKPVCWASWSLFS